MWNGGSNQPDWPKASSTISTCCWDPYCTNCGKRGEASPAASASTKPKIDDEWTTPTPREYIEEFLRCSVCLDFPASPIHTCDNAHLFCGQCAPNLVACQICRNTELRPSPPCEKLAKEVNKRIQCANLEAGCKEGVLSTKFAEHLTSCYYREIRCQNYMDCGQKVKFHEYTKHLEDAHYEEIHIWPEMTESYFYNEKRHVKSWDVLNHWDHAVVKFKSQHFIVHAQVSAHSQLFYSWVCLLGDKDLAEKYICKVKFRDSKASNKLGCKWTIPVLPFHEIPSNEFQAKLFECPGGSAAVAAVPLAALRKWGVLDKFEYLGIDVTYKIKEA